MLRLAALIRQFEFFGRANSNPPTAATISAILRISPGRNGRAPMRKEFDQPTPVTRASQAQPPVKIITSPEISAPKSLMLFARRLLKYLRTPEVPRSAIQPATNAAGG